MSATDALPRVSIIIPVYNGANYLNESIKSALTQTYKNIEVIVVNDGSNDNGATEKIAKSYGNEIKYYKKKNGGVATALNLGIKKMTGEYFSWLSHDDLYVETKIEEQIGYLKKNRRDDLIIACNAMTLYPSGVKKKEKIDVSTFGFIDIFLSTSALVGLNGCSLLIPKRAFEECGDFDANHPVTQDYELWFRMKDKFRFVLLEKHLVISRRHPDQDSAKKQEYLYSAADNLHYNFLKTISYNRFEVFFKENKHNIEHTYNNYKVYRMRGFNKTASRLLSPIIKYYYLNDKRKFYDTYASEIGATSSMQRMKVDRFKKIDQLSINAAYSKMIKSGIEDMPIRQVQTKSSRCASNSRVGKTINKITESIRHDGLSMTMERIVRRALKKLKRTQ